MIQKGGGDGAATSGRPLVCAGSRGASAGSPGNHQAGDHPGNDPGVPDGERSSPNRPDARARRTGRASERIGSRPNLLKREPSARKPIHEARCPNDRVSADDPSLLAIARGSRRRRLLGLRGIAGAPSTGHRLPGSHGGHLHEVRVLVPVGYDSGDRRSGDGRAARWRGAPEGLGQSPTGYRFTRRGLEKPSRFSQSSKRSRRLSTGRPCICAPKPYHPWNKRGRGASGFARSPAPDRPGYQRRR